MRPWCRLRVCLVLFFHSFPLFDCASFVATSVHKNDSRGSLVSSEALSVVSEKLLVAEACFLFPPPLSVSSFIGICVFFCAETENKIFPLQFRDRWCSLPNHLAMWVTYHPVLDSGGTPPPIHGQNGTIWQLVRALFPGTWRTLSPDALFPTIWDTASVWELARNAYF